MIDNLLIKLETAFAVSPFVGLGVSFLAGVLVSISPCIYPLIPITLGITGAVSASSRIKGFLISLVFVLGVAFVYTCLGIASSLLGILLGSFFVNPVTYLVLAIVFLVLGGAHFGIIKINIPFFSGQPQTSSKKGLFSVFLLGIVSGLAIIPCSFPVLGAILSLISLKANIFYAGTALFLFSLGYGTLLIILGTFTSLIRKLPKQSLGFILFTKAWGVIFIVAAIYFILKFINLMQ